MVIEFYDLLGAPDISFNEVLSFSAVRSRNEEPLEPGLPLGQRGDGAEEVAVADVPLVDIIGLHSVEDNEALVELGYALPLDLLQVFDLLRVEFDPVALSALGQDGLL